MTPDDSLNSPVAPANMGIGQANAPAVGKPAPAPQRKSPNVMGQVEQQAGQGAHKPAMQIIQDYVMQQTGDQKQVDRMMAMLAELIKKKLSRLIQFGNTVFWATQAGQGALDVHIFSEESPKVLAHRIQQAYQWAKAHGFRKITSTFTDQQQLGVVKASAIPYTLKQTQVSDGHKMVPGFNMTMEVK